MYSAKNSNVWYTQKKIGEKTEMLDKCLLGWLIGILMLGILIGPLVIFSNIGGFVSPNHVIGGQVRMAFIIDHNYTIAELNKVDPQYNSTQLKAVDQAGVFSFEKHAKAPAVLAADGDKLSNEYSNSTYKKHYEIYADKNPLLANYTKAAYAASPFDSSAEPATRFFRADQVQSAVLSEFALDRWYLSGADYKILKKEIVKAMDPDDPAYHLSFALDGFFERRLPPAHKRAHFHDVKTLNISTYADCLTRRQLLEFAAFECPADQQRLYAPTNAETTIRFSQVYNPNKLLGATSTASAIWRQVHQRGHSSQKKDITVRFQCPD